LALLACAVPARAVEAFPKTLVFQPLLADPRWPSFAGTMQRYLGPQRHVFWAANFGESFPFVGNRGGEIWQFGLQASVFTIWDVTTESDDLVNADFLVGFPYTWRKDRWSGMYRIFHVSSHLGDEFLLSHKSVDRVNISYEALDTKLSYDFEHGFRLYGGGGKMFRKDPPELKTWFAQVGGEWLGPSFAWGILRPVAAADLQKHEQNGWGATGTSLRAGIQMQHRYEVSRRMQLLFEYYRGHDPNGQFFLDTVQLLGLGLHVYF
jgi:hypothetical protein